jgi:hypothetical protein
MSFFDWFLGRNKSNENPKIKKDQSNPKIQTETFDSNEGSFAIKTVSFQTNDIITIGGIKEDGSSTISSGNQSITFNEPIQEEDDGKRENDAL